ncbi:hypothetical protein F2Q69_00021926 [Brassica cretica]|uniref:Uncharacterized protein n=1 Tax=Brassica cretica TaxID=69181 RepID=A0A8S9Q2B2_BRACR|nr:hypothetical protein F2Q69_00021926 [Brassica cretica]
MKRGFMGSSKKESADSLTIQPGKVEEADTSDPTSASIRAKASRNVDSKHLRPLICEEEAAGFHKRVKRKHDLVKFVVPCSVFKAEFPIPPDKIDKGPAEAAWFDTDRIPSVDIDQIPSNDINKPASIDATTSPSFDTGRVSEPNKFDVCGNLRDGDATTRSDKSGGKKRMNWKKRKRIKDGPQVSLVPHFSDGVRKSRVRSRCFSQPFSKLRALFIAEMIDRG